MKSPFKLRKYKNKWLLLLFFLSLISFIIGFLFGRQSKGEKLKSVEKENLLLRKELDGWKERGRINCSHEDFHNFIHEWDCDYCGKEIENQPELEKHLIECKEAEKIFAGIEDKKNGRLVCDKKTSLIEKGYQGQLISNEVEGLLEIGSISQIRKWGLMNKVVLPDLRKEKREGVVKQLGVMGRKKGSEIVFGEKGEVSDLVIFLVPRFESINRQNFPELLEKEKSGFFYTIHGNKGVVAYEKSLISYFIRKILQKGGSWDYNVYLLDVDKYGSTNKSTPIMGNSGSVSLYLSLLSAYYQKPISKEVVATGCIDVENYLQFNYCPFCLKVTEELRNNFSQSRVRSVGELLLKSKVAVETGVKKLLLSVEQKVDYEKTVPREIREKLKVYYIKDVEELEELFLKGEFS